MSLAKVLPTTRTRSVVQPSQGLNGSKKLTAPSLAEHPRNRVKGAALELRVYHRRKAARPFGRGAPAPLGQGDRKTMRNNL